jgi:hypothetical protein
MQLGFGTWRIDRGITSTLLVVALELVLCTSAVHALDEMIEVRLTGDQYELRYTGYDWAPSDTLTLHMDCGMCENVRIANGTTGVMQVRNTS